MIGAAAGGKMNERKPKKKNRDEEKRKQKEQHFVPYVPGDHQAESQLKVDKCVVDFYQFSRISGFNSEK